MLATIRNGEAAARRNLRVQLLLERVTGRSIESGYQSQAMLDGIAREADALRRYEAAAGVLVRRTGFLFREDLMVGASLDGHLGNFEVVVEVKSPIPATHYDYIMTGQVPDDYRKQMIHQMWITGARLGHFVSYQPDFPESTQLLIREIKRNDIEIAQYEKSARAFLAEVDRACEAFRTVTCVSDVLTAALMEATT